MTASTATASTATITDADVVRAVFGAFASGDLAALSDLLHAGATWHHHNDDRLGGIHRGADAICSRAERSAVSSCPHGNRPELLIRRGAIVAVGARAPNGAGTCAAQAATSPGSTSGRQASRIHGGRYISSHSCINSDPLTNSQTSSTVPFTSTIS
jgi:hypothetical protein